MGFLAVRWTTGTQRRGLTLILAAITAASTMAAAPAQAAPNTAKAWGLNSGGQLGDGTTSGPEKCGVELHACSTVPVSVSGLRGVVAVAGGGSFTSSEYSLALLENGAVMAWGADPGGALGDGSTGASDVPVPVCAVGATSPCSEESKQLKEVVAIAAGSEHSVALLKNGTVVAWGAIAFGGLGDGTENRSNVPVRVCAVGTPTPKEKKEKGEAPGCPGGPYLEGVTAIAAGDRFSLAVSNGTVLSWGEESSAGYLGDGSTEFPQERFAPGRVCATGPQVPCPTGPYLTGASAVSADSTNALALLGSGKVMAWGDNEDGQLGNGTEAKSDVPVEVSGLSGATAIAAGGTLINGGNPHMLALLENGTVKAWGDNEFGQLGQGMTTPPGPEECGSFKTPCSKKPVTVSGLSKVTAIAARGNHSLAIEQGEIFAWGKNSSGELGDGSSEGPEHCFNGFSLEACSNLPVQVSNSGGATSIGAGESFSLAFGPPPAVTKVEPSHGPPGGGTTVTITGEAFTGASAVAFGSTNAASFTVNSASSLTAVSPTGSGVVDVTVTNPWGTSTTSAADQFSYEPPPAVTEVEPNHGPAAGGTSVTITGASFTGASAVKFGSTSATSFKVNSDSSITTVSPAGTGTVDVTVTTPSGTSATSAADRFTYGPTVSKVEPNHGSPSGGTTVTITGTGFTGATTVKFAATTAAKFTVNSATSITAVSPKAMGALTVDVTVTTPAGTSPTSPTDQFTYMKK
jgi:alpha-tubulin suppressor-like RCC1 family protein